jgi:hypothetical protein
MACRAARSSGAAWARRPPTARADTEALTGSSQGRVLALRRDAVVHRRPANPRWAPQVRGAGSGNLSVFLAASPLAEGIGGRYFEDVNEADTRTQSPGMFGTGVADYALEPGLPNCCGMCPQRWLRPSSADGQT